MRRIELTYIIKSIRIVRFKEQARENRKTVNIGSWSTHYCHAFFSSIFPFLFALFSLAFRCIFFLWWMVSLFSCLGHIFFFWFRSIFPLFFLLFSFSLWKLWNSKIWSIIQYIDKRQHITTKCVSFKWKLDGCVRSYCLRAFSRNSSCPISFFHLFTNFRYSSLFEKRWLFHCIVLVFRRLHAHTKEQKVEHEHTFSLNTENKYNNFLAIQNKNGNLKKEPTSEKWLYHVYCVVWRMVFDSTFVCLFPTHGVCLFCR